MIKQIQRIVQNVLEAKKLTDSAIGIVESINPIKVKIDNRFVVDDSFLTFLSHIETKYIEVGNRLLLLRVQNGQHFIVQDVLEPRKLIYYSEGIVKTTIPLKIEVDNKYTIEQPIIHALPFVEHMRGPLEVGNRVLLLRVQNGQLFILLDKL
jgi:hypothetical protein